MLTIAVPFHSKRDFSHPSYSLNNRLFPFIFSILFLQSRDALNCGASYLDMVSVIFLNALASMITLQDYTPNFRTNNNFTIQKKLQETTPHVGWGHGSFTFWSGGFIFGGTRILKCETIFFDSKFQLFYKSCAICSIRSLWFYTASHVIFFSNIEKSNSCNRTLCLVKKQISFEFRFIQIA